MEEVNLTPRAPSQILEVWSGSFRVNFYCNVLRNSEVIGMVMTFLGNKFSFKLEYTLGGDTSCMFEGPMCGGGVFLEGLSITYNHYLATLEEPLFLHKGGKSAILSSLFYL